MLYPTVQSVSPKGQVVLRADVRRALSVGKFVLVVPSIHTGEIVIKPLVGDDPVKAGYGMLSGGPSLVKVLLDEKKDELGRDRKKHVKVRL